MKITYTPPTEEDRATMTSGKITIEMEPMEWLQREITAALEKLLTDPRPLIVGADGTWRYQGTERTDFK